MATGIPAGLSRADGRKFALTLAAAFAVFAVLAWWRGHPVAVRVIGGIAAVFFVLAVTIPGKLGPLYRAWMGLAHAISRVTTPIFLGVVYFLVFTPMALFMKAIGRSPLHVKRDAATYWVARPPGARQSDPTRQF